MSLPAGNYAPAEISVLDASGEIGRFRVYGTVLTAANFDAQRTAWAALIQAINAIKLGTNVMTSYGIETTYIPNLPSDNAAQRENKLLVMFRNASTGQKYTATIPCIDLTALEFQSNAGDFVALDSPADVATFVAAFEAFVKSPVGNNAVEITGLKFVGRNT